jgi:DNA-binding winged helix-turn-helix (wHTH) protein/tetratricopeptide (TPR) repeat protein
LLPWSFLEQDLRLVSGDRAVQLTPKAAAVLGCLVRRRGQLVSREVLLEEVWGGLQVSPDLVREYIFDLRTALGDDARRPSYIETVRGRGFRLIGDVSSESKAKSPRGSAMRPRRVTVAVLRPEVFCSSPRWRWFGDSLADDLTTNLAGFGDIAVLARRAAYSIGPKAALEGAAGALGADYLIESSIAVVDDHVRAQFQLINRQTATHAGTKRLEQPIDDVARLGEELAATVANWIGSWRGAILRAEHSRLRLKNSSELGAYDHYVLACAAERVRDREHASIALRHLEFSLDLDPDNARAWLLLAIILGRPFQLFGEPMSAGDKSRASDAIANAYAADPQDPLVLAEVCCFRARDGDMGGAITALERATEIGAAQAETMAVCANLYATIAGDMAMARRLVDRAHKLNPTPKEWCRFTIARVAYFSGDFGASCDATGPAPALLPLSIFCTLALAMQGRTSEATRARRALASQFPKVDFEDYAVEFPIVAPNARALYQEGVRRLPARQSA